MGGTAAGKNAVENNLLGGGTEDGQVKAAQEHAKNIMSCADNPASASCQKGLASQEELRSFQAAVNTATKSNMPYSEKITVDGWQLEIKPPRAAGELPTIIHARYLGSH